MNKKNKKTKNQTAAASEPEGFTHEQKITHLDAEIAKAEEEGDEEYLRYLMTIKEMTINVYEGGTVIFQSGVLPKY